MTKKVHTDAASARCAGAAALFAIFAPTLAAFFGERVVLLIFSAAFLAVSGIFALKKGKIMFTAQTLCLAVTALFAAGAIAFASDKGGAFYIASVIICSAAASLSLSAASCGFDARQIRLMTAKAVYVGATLYALFAILYQAFVSTDFASYKMDFGRGTSFFTSAFMILGALSALELYSGRRKTAGFFAALVIIAYAFVFSVNAAGFFIAALTAFAASLKSGKKRRAAIPVLLAALFSAIAVVTEIVKNGESVGVYLKAAAAAMFKINPEGLGGSVELCIAGCENPPLAVVLATRLGLFGTALMLALAALALRGYFKRKSVFALAETAILIWLLFSRGECAVLMTVILTVRSASEGKRHGAARGAAFGALPVAAAIFMLYMGIAHVPAVIGGGASSPASAEKFYAASGSMELFDSAEWYEAFLAASDENSQSAMAETYLLNAINFDKKNITYKSALADLYTSEGRDDDSLAVWDEIMEISNDERLYGTLAERICSVMEDSTDDSEYERELYERITSLASEASSPEVIKEVNDIAARSQRYYIEGVEGTGSQGDMYMTPEDSSETASGLPTEEESEQ